MMDQFAPRNDQDGIFERVCPECEQPFRTDNPTSIYCSEKCKKAAHNRRNYERHREARIKAVQRRRRREQEK